MSMDELARIQKLLVTDPAFNAALKAANDAGDINAAAKILQGVGAKSVKTHDRNHPPGPELDEQGRPCNHACWYPFDGPVCICMRVGDGG